jgi:hypothetical protein
VCTRECEHMKQHQQYATRNRLNINQTQLTRSLAQHQPPNTTTTRLKHGNVLGTRGLVKLAWRVLMRARRCSVDSLPSSALSDASLFFAVLVRLSVDSTYTCGGGQRGSRMKNKCSFGCGTKCDHNDGRACGSWCGAYQSWMYPWSRDW